ncbi:Similar to Glycosyl transferases group 1 [Hyphomicrobium sp. GJ21]|uniref:glycosyltransferase family 4 protein n=1 Tax=Hyphomicrobium sp. GJ21 TaxID=113574 RepID=UPI000622B842|nr:glycosyltransferase family 4 protein [Hyphomicrobium sp. GJ21]CEJ87278.1 Similar to Glycosyl transferases group 1 [Hyphomicrobium sp. GJ21]
MKIAHLTSVHARFDTRIFLKQCRSLAAAGNEVTLVVADGQGESNRDGVQIIDIGKSYGRRDRMLGATRRVLRCAVAIDADIYHFHDPELLPIGLALKRRGKRVIYDAHEDLPGDILSKSYIPAPLRHPIAAVANRVQNFVGRKIDRVVTATPAIRDSFTRVGIPAIDINNFPLQGELEAEIAWSNKQNEACYVGGIAEIRGIREVIAAMAMTKSGTRLNIAGTFQEQELKIEMEAMPGWSRVNALGFLSRDEVRDTLGRSVAGIVTFLPLPNHIDAQPNKMFEYMSAGIPVIASNFPLWREIVEGNECGLCVDPLDPKAIAAAIDQLVENPLRAKRMGENGRRAVVERYNWANEERKLLQIYDEVAA